MDTDSSSDSTFPGPTTKERRTFECKACNLRFTRFHTLKNHLSVHVHGSIFKCSACDKRFGRLNDKKRHEKTQHAEKKFVCRGQHQSGGFWGCGKAFARKDALGEHLRSKTGQRCRERVVSKESSDVITIDLTGHDSDTTARDSTEPEDANSAQPTATTKQRFSKDVEDERRAVSEKDMDDDTRERDIIDALWETIDLLPLL